MPIAIDSAVRISVLRRPFSTGGEKRYSATTDQPKPSLVSRELTAIAARTASTATASHRPGWRTGTALIGSGRGAAAAVASPVGAATAQLRISDVGMAPSPTDHLSRIFL